MYENQQWKIVASLSSLDGKQTYKRILLEKSLFSFVLEYSNTVISSSGILDQPIYLVREECTGGPWSMRINYGCT